MQPKTNKIIFLKRLLIKPLQMKTESEANAHEALFTHSLISDRETMQTVPCGELGEMEYATAKPFPLGEMKGSQPQTPWVWSQKQNSHSLTAMVPEMLTVTKWRFSFRNTPDIHSADTGQDLPITAAGRPAGPRDRETASKFPHWSPCSPFSYSTPPRAITPC